MALHDKLEALLDGPHIKMRDKKSVIDTLIKIQQGGIDKLQIITDFDRTVSKHHNNGVETKSSYCVFETIPTLPKSFIEEAQKLYKRFRVVEDNPNLTIAEKIPHMEEWWDLNEKILIGLPYNQEEIKQAVLDSGVTLRENADVCFKKLHENDIPVLVFSAGLGYVVEAILERYNLLYDNVKIISNFFKVVDGKIAGFQGKSLHVYNKNQHAIENTDYFKTLSSRTNAIVMGDSLGDANMDEGITAGGAVLKIGFLSLHIDDYLPQYLEHFDIVLVDDQTMNVFKGILSHI